MITQLRFKNWRSLKDVTIDNLQPINVFIGANSSGKTNILDALYFWRHSLNAGIVQAVFDWKVSSKVLTLGVPKDETIELELSYLVSKDQLLTKTMRLQFHKQLVPFRYGYQFKDGSKVLFDEPLTEIPRSESIKNAVQARWGGADVASHRQSAPEQMNLFVKQRWQMLDENFMPPLSLSSGEIGDVYLMNQCADNLLFILDFMQQTNSELYDQLQSDFRWLLDHVDQIATEHNDRETRLKLTEKRYRQDEAPSVSAGTSRLLAMLTAFYALDMQFQDVSGLVVIEEPDTALNPGLLRRFVEQLRTYVGGPHPRQIIMTTHNPSFLDYFEPEEVRIVERDENGYTTVNKIPNYIEEIWLRNGEYGLGDVWMTRSFGGVPE